MQCFPFEFMTVWPEPFLWQRTIVLQNKRFRLHVHTRIQIHNVTKCCSLTRLKFEIISIENGSHPVWYLCTKSIDNGRKEFSEFNRCIGHIARDCLQYCSRSNKFITVHRQWNQRAHNFRTWQQRSRKCTYYVVWMKFIDFWSMTLLNVSLSVFSIDIKRVRHR